MKDRPDNAVPDLVDSVIQQGLARRASDIHLASGENGLTVRFRVDGMLQHGCEVPPEFRAAVIARIKIMAGMDITEHRLPQDGRIKIREELRSVDIRISTLPSLHGEKVVMRLLDLDNTALPLSSTGLADDHLREISRLIRRPQGVIFVTGPTGRACSGPAVSARLCGDLEFTTLLATSGNVSHGAGRGRRQDGEGPS